MEVVTGFRKEDEILICEADQLPEVITDEEISIQKLSGGEEDDPMQALLREQTRVLLSMNKYLFYLVVLLCGLCVVGITMFYKLFIPLT